LNQTGELKGGVLATENVNEFVVEGGTVFGSLEVALVEFPSGWFSATRVTSAADSGLALGVPIFSCRYLEGDDVGRGHGPVLGLRRLFARRSRRVRVGESGRDGDPIRTRRREKRRACEESGEGKPGADFLVAEALLRGRVPRFVAAGELTVVVFSSGIAFSN